MSRPGPDRLGPDEVLRELDLDAHVRDPGIKQRFVTAMFEVIAPRYDRFTRAFSCGMDRGWKRSLLEEAARELAPGDLVLDLACGTGDIALGVARRVPEANVLGLDISRRMLTAAAARTAEVSGTRPRFSAGHMPQLPLRDGSVRLVTAGYAVRNAPDPLAALDEIARVLAPGGRLLALDFYRPSNRLWRRVYLWYLKRAGNLFGRLWHGQAQVYGYIAPSIEHFLSYQDFSTELERRGLVVERVGRKLMGGICIHVAHKPRAADEAP
jgi:demethylmenaquinone methyltransferase/2-methoxy-6-polyprenyl-1,4-benzoquinol methylase